MGFGSFFSHLVAPVTKALGPVGTAVLLPAIPLTQIASNVIDVAAAKVGSALVGPGHNVAPATPSGPYNVTQPTRGYTQPVYYGAPTYYAPTYPEMGGQQWGYSTPSVPSFQPSAPMYRDYSAPPTPSGDRSWEDLILGSALFL